MSLSLKKMVRVTQARAAVAWKCDKGKAKHPWYLVSMLGDSLSLAYLTYQG